MASLQYFSFRNLLLLYLVFFFFSGILVSTLSETDPQNKSFLGGRRMLEMEEEQEEDQTKKKFDLSTKKKTKLIKPKIATNSTKNTLKKSSDLLKPSAHKNKTSQLIVTKKSSESKSKTSDKKQSIIEPKSESSSSSSSSSSKKQTSESKSKSQQQKKIQKPTKSYWMDQEDEEEDIISELRDLPSKFHQALIPDLQRISTISKAYLTKGFKPFVGNKYAPTIASILACIFIIVPFLLVSLVFNRIKAYFSLQKLLIFIQVYLSIYFLTLSLSSLVTGLEPLKFFYATSLSSYVCLQVLQTLGYVLYVLLLLMYLVVVFSTENGLGSKLLGLGQTMVGFAVGFHYYVTVFHRAVLHQPPKTNWKVQGIYAVCFFVICLFVNADERRKKTYLHGGGDGKKS
ncbi:uncharacterized protein LOC122648469 [Telopea speciosissima]|uniref:uncharacterized protein LOC122648469 n=1 Tax=Telopea speciosissima TaxID=54955 RepID=UPI001CC3B161|nr:uncharacterized protein LOC122648469 [Telopea speciosissima]